MQTQGRPISAVEACCSSDRRSSDPNHTPIVLPGQQKQLVELEYLTEAQVALMTSMHPTFFAKARIRGDGPPFIRLGRSIRYHLPGFHEWMAARTRLSTSTPANDNHRTNHGHASKRAGAGA
jgi:hypothetical protein